MLRQSEVPEVTTYSALNSACEKGKRLACALELFKGMLRKSEVPDATTYNALISACEKRKQTEGALELFEKMS